ncbi:antiviral reverse transcriptase Drt2 [Acinetobacter sp. SAAs474]|uniref:antiviral reverse transcriptase Drt2 n=1 Tax=Acinetobacter sp. SAAs474 TaxID=3036710 RepID=UPI002934EC5D|nr:antiviral reverse transcriptase Drt2 [Acinetobacter sp. SAAs474]WOE39903.1 antiviral reverse transcriptase Drt2 [Acinetobacter sp. SAAs474]
MDKNSYRNKLRSINFPSHIDGNIYAYYSKILEYNYLDYLLKNNLESNITAFRKITEIDDSGNKKSLCNIHFARNVFDFIRKKGNCFVLCLDISGFFDNLDHEILKNNWIKLLEEEKLPKDHYQVYKSLTKYSYVDKKDLYKVLGLSLNSRTLHRRLDRLCDIQDFRKKVRENNLIKKNLKYKGIPQGSPISGMLSNIYMMDFDKKISKIINDLNGRYYRYCDDMIFIVDESYSSDIFNIIFDEIKKIKLKINNKKTQKIIFRDGKIKLNNPPTFNTPNQLQYLGILFDGDNVFLRETGLSKLHYKLRKAIRMRSTHYGKLKFYNRHNNQEMYMKTLYSRFTYIGKRNYLSYAYRVADVFQSKNIKSQVKNHFGTFNAYLDKKSI